MTFFQSLRYLVFALPILCISALFIAGCDQQKTEEDFDDSSTWRSIQTRILDPNCKNCHASGSSFAEQSGFVLDEALAYGEVVNATVKNTAAKKDGLEMLGRQGLPSLYKSYFWEKINYPNEDHYMADHPYYGALMPLGGDPLTNGELEFIRQWIVAGAPKEGKVADLKLLEDQTRYTRPAFRPLAKPENGIQIKLDPFEVAPNFDREFFQYRLLGNTEDLYVNGYEIEMRSGSHHFLLYNFRSSTPTSAMPKPDAVRDIKNQDGTYNYQNMVAMQYHTFFAGTQWPRVKFSFPQGVAIKVPKNAGFDLNSHYVNKTKAPITGEVQVNLYTVPSNTVQKEAKILDLNNTNIFLPPKQVTTIEKTYTFSQKRNVIQLFSHAHQKMKEFKVYVVGGANDGKMVYYANDWEHPPILSFDTPLVLEAGQGLRCVATYDNDTNNAISFGLKAEDEMMILFGYYY